MPWEIKPCPFDCAAYAVEILVYPSLDGWSAYVTCWHCRCMGPVGKGKTEMEAKEIAFELWNERTKTHGKPE